jgi:hypothetical protein
MLKNTAAAQIPSRLEPCQFLSLEADAVHGVAVKEVVNDP